MMMASQVLMLMLAIMVHATALRGGNTSCLPCLLARPHVLWDENEPTTVQNLHEITKSSPSSFRCLTQGPGYQASYALPEWFIRAHSDIIEQKSAQEVCLPGAVVKLTSETGDGEVVMDEDDVDENLANILMNNDRQLFARDTSVRYGTQRLLAVHISTLSEQPDVTAQDMQMALFGTGSGTLRPGSVTVVEQIHHITKGQLLYTPASGPNIQEGMLEITLKKAGVAGEDVFNIIPFVHSKTKQALGGTPLNEVADRILFCLPSKTLKGGKHWRAFTYLFGPYSYYQAATCSLLSVLVHELGHQMGFHHSGKGENVYGDRTGYMGGWHGPKMAFNGHKHWISGWFGPAAVEVDPQQQQHTYRRLLGFVDYNISYHECLGESDAVIVRAGELYLQYNQAKGYNVDVRYPNTVTITEADRESVVSDALAALEAGEFYAYPNFDKDGNSLIVEVCVIFEELAVINLYLSIDGPRWFCVTGAPTSTPTAAPSMGFNATVTPTMSLPPNSSPCGGPPSPNTPIQNESLLARVVALIRNKPWLSAGVIGVAAVFVFGILLCCCCCRICCVSTRDENEQLPAKSCEDDDWTCEQY